MPYTVISPTEISGPIVYTTKNRPFHTAICEDEQSSQLGLIGRYGLPSRTDLPFIQSFAARHELSFLGDLDPPDLLIFAWLRIQLRPQPIRYLGISDWYVERLRVVLRQSSQISLSESEQGALALFAAVLPDCRSLVGDDCWALLQSGRKIELEAIVSGMTNRSLLLRPVLAERP